MDHVEEIKQKLDIAVVVGEYLELKKAGVNYKGKCPFHNEKTPSFIVNPDRQRFHCFGCGEGGDIFTFVQKMEGTEFPEALRVLAQKAGVQLKQFDPRVTSIKNRLLDLSSDAAKFWHDKLNHRDGENALNYLNNRKVSSEMQKEFKLGYAADSWDDIYKHLLNKGYNESEIFKAGLIVRKENGSGYYDRFRDRIMFPIQDLHGHVVGFTGRTLKSDEMAKYVNTPEGPIYHKGKVIYGLDKAKQAIRKQDYVVVVEGNVDVITAHQFGYKNVVACSGTALTVDQIAILKRYTNNIQLCFDQDDAGQTAAQRTIDLLLPAEMNTKIVQLVSGKDPDECLHNNVKDWEASLRGSKLVMQFYFDKYLTAVVLANISEKTKAIDIVLKQIKKISNPVERAHWVKQLSLITADAVETLRARMNQVQLKPGFLTKKQNNDTVAPSREKTWEQKNFERFLTILLNHPYLISYAQENFKPEMIVDNQLNGFYQSLLLLYNKNKKINSGELIKTLDTEDKLLEQGYLDSLVLSIHNVYEGFEDKELQVELVALIRALKRRSFESKIAQLNKEMLEAERTSDSEKRNEAMKNIQNYQEQLIKLK